MSLRDRALGLVEDVARFAGEVVEAVGHRPTPVVQPESLLLTLDIARLTLSDFVTDTEIGPIIAEDDTLKSTLQTIAMLDEEISRLGGEVRAPVESPFRNRKAL